MPSFITAQKTYNAGKHTLGQVRKKTSDVIMEATWDGDIQSKTCYIYDYYHDGEKDKAYNLSPALDNLKTPIEAKFIITQYPTLAKDQVEYHIQFKPSQKCPLDYYDYYNDKFSARYPIGLYIDIPNLDGVYERWLICGYEYANQFIKYSVLPCNYELHWVKDGILYNMWCISRLRNSYNSGLWTDYVMTTVENQDQLWLPMNDITKNIFYDDRFIIDARQEEGIKPQISWKVSKVENIHPTGIAKITVAQDLFKDDVDKFINGFWYANYGQTVYTPESFDEIPEEYSRIIGEISCIGKKQIKVSGGYKTIRINYFNLNSENCTETIEDKNQWTFFVDEIPVDKLMEVKQGDNTFNIKIKFLGDDSYLNKTLQIVCKNSFITTLTELDIVNL